jgi:hypothetical protein
MQGEISWLDTPLNEFRSRLEKQEDGTIRLHDYPHGEGEAQGLMMRLFSGVDFAYERFLEEEEGERLETKGEVPVIRSGHREYEALDSLKLRDLPAILDTLVVLEEEQKQRKREESERKAAERRARERVRAKERRKLKKLGAW